MASGQAAIGGRLSLKTGAAWKRAGIRIKAMNEDVFTRLSATEMAEGVRSGRWTARELVAASLERIGRLDPELNAFTVVRTEEALAEADLLDAELARERELSRAGNGRKAAGTNAAPTTGNVERLLAGVPIAVKEEYDVAGLPTTLGGYGNSSPAAADSEVIRRVRAAGAIIVGKTTMPEFGRCPETISDRYGATLNPWRRDFSPGGSSGGSAVAVAMAMTPLALGADGGGSIRLPASCCGILGLKPERGRVTLAPSSQHWHALVVLGGLSRTAADSALLYDVIAGTLPSDKWRAQPVSESYRDVVARGTGPLRIAWTGRSPVPGLKNDPEVDRALAALVRRLARLDHDVRETHAAWPVPTDAFLSQYFSGMAVEADSVEAPEKLERHTRRIAAVGRLIPTRLVRFAERRGERIARAFNERFLPTADVLVMPTIPILPRPSGWLESRSTFASVFRGTPTVANTSIFNVTGHPALSIPGGVSADGLPIGMQIVTRPGREGLLLALAAQLEKDEPWPTPPGL